MRIVYLFETLSTEKYQFSYADQVSVGDEVLVEGNDYLAPVEVIEVSSTKMQGKLY